MKSLLNIKMVISYSFKRLTRWIFRYLPKASDCYNIVYVDFLSDLPLLDRGSCNSFSCACKHLRNYDHRDHQGLIQSAAS